MKVESTKPVTAPWIKSRPKLQIVNKPQPPKNLHMAKNVAKLVGAEFDNISSVVYQRILL